MKKGIVNYSQNNVSIIGHFGKAITSNVCFQGLLVKVNLTGTGHYF